MFPVAQLSMVTRTGWCVWSISKYGDWRVCVWKTWVLGIDPVSLVSLTDSFLKWSGLRFRGIIKDVGDLPGFGYVLVILFWKDTTFTQEMAIIGTASLFAEQAGPSWTVGSCVRLVWSFAAGRFMIATNRGVHNLGIVSCTYFVKEGGEGL